jgi:hypothetical protein
VSRFTGLLVLAAALAAGGCAAAANGTMPASGGAADTLPAKSADLRLELEKSAVVEGGALEVTFSEVVADSRCPKGETCIWEGEAIVRLALRSGDESGEVELHTSSRGPGTGGFAGWVIELVSLEPHPVAGKPAATAYIAALRVSRGDAAGNATQ